MNFSDATASGLALVPASGGSAPQCPVGFTPRVAQMCYSNGMGLDCVDVYTGDCDFVSCPAGTTWNGSQCVYPPNPPACNQSTTYREAQCPAGYTGTQTQKRITDCRGTIILDWTDAPGNSCRPIPPAPQCTPTVSTVCGLTTSFNPCTGQTITSGQFNRNLPGCSDGRPTPDPVPDPVVPGCRPGFYCNANNLYYTDNRCESAFVQACAYRCAGGACVVAPPPIPVPDPVGGTSGRLEARPTLVRAGDSTKLYWHYTNVTRCTVTGTNGDSFTATYAGASGRTSGPINTRTTFTLNCTAIPSATPSTVTESVIINVAPAFIEI